MKISRFNIPNFVLFVAFFMIFIVSKVIKFNMLDSSFQSDSEWIITVMKNETIDNVYGYGFAAKFYNAINIFKTYDIKVWDHYIGVLGTTLVFLYVRIFKKSTYTIFELLTLFLLTFFLNIYVFCLSKDLIQFVLIMIFILILLKVKKITYKIIISCLPLLLLGLVLRNYFFVVCLIYIFFLFVLLFRKKTSLIRYVFSISIVLIAFLTGIIILKKVNYNLYFQVTNANTIYSSDSANTLIGYIFENSTNKNFILNYLINFLRLLFPIELVSKGIYYYVFLFYHFTILILFLKWLKMNHGSINVCCIFAFALAFFMISVIFEPDFGSFLRHQISISCVYVFVMLMSDKMKGDYDYEEVCCCNN